MKTIVNTILVGIVVLGLFDFLIVQKRDAKELLNPKTWDMKAPRDLQPFLGDEDKVDDNNSKSKSVSEKSEDTDVITFYISGLGDYTESDLNQVKQIVENFYHYKCIITKSRETTSDLYTDNGNSLDAFKCLNSLSVDHKRYLYVTNELLYEDDVKLRGYARLHGNTVIVRSQPHMKETVIHELGHTLGLEHCDDKTCIMALHNDAEDSGDFCKKCKNKIGR
jgi:predicted Zn-dependent protease